MNLEWINSTIFEKEAALIKATDYLDANYLFKSVKRSNEQSLENPRYNEPIIKPAIVKATMELAFLLLNTNPNQAVTERNVLSEEEALEGVGSTKKTYSDIAVLDPFPSVTAILKSIKTPRRGSSASSTRLIG